MEFLSPHPPFRSRSMGPPPSPGGRGVNPPVDQLIFILIFLSLLSPFFSKIGAPFSYLTSDFGAAVERPQQQKGISNRAQKPPLAKVTRPACGTGLNHLRGAILLVLPSFCYPRVTPRKAAGKEGPERAEPRGPRVMFCYT